MPMELDEFLRRLFDAAGATKAAVTAITVCMTQGMRTDSINSSFPLQNSEQSRARTQRSKSEIRIRIRN